MQKSDLKALAEEMYSNLINKIDSSESISKEQMVDYLKDAIRVISSLQAEELDSIEHAKIAYNNSYKELVEQSLNSYEYTSEKFEELTMLQEKTIQQYTQNGIDVEKIAAKFSEIQTHMTQEIKRANSVINQLTNKVQELEKTSNLDPLTKVYNRRALNSFLGNLFANNIKYPLHIMMLDVDNFKSINDNYGHITGDKILVYIATLLKKTLRDGDKIFRYGGEEFTITINRSSDEQAEAVANRLLKLIRTSNLIYLGEKLEVTASIGLTKMLENDNSLEELLSRADKALYLSKSSGKNKVSRIYE